MYQLLIFIARFLSPRFQNSMLGRTVLGLMYLPPINPIHIVAATRFTEDEFWSRSALGKSLRDFLPDPLISAHITFENKIGLSHVYNKAASLLPHNTIVVFMHDDVWLTDPNWVNKVRQSLQRFDIVGVAGSTRRIRGQPAWLFRRYSGTTFTGDDPYWSGEISHGHQPLGEVSIYGPAPRYCALIDGVFMACRNDSLRSRRLRFDERFSFHFYDIDFCRQARGHGLLLGTWPIKLLHESRGQLGSDVWQRSLAVYRRKYWPFI